MNMSITVKFSEKDLENLDNLETDQMEYVDVPYGIYEVAVAGITEKDNKKGVPMVTVRFKVLAGEYEGQSIWYNQNVDTVWKFKVVAKLLNSMKTNVNIASSTYVVNGEVDFEAYNEMLKAVYDDITEQGFEYALEYKENEKGFKTYTITDVFSE